MRQSTRSLAHIGLRVAARPLGVVARPLRVVARQLCCVGLLLACAGCNLLAPEKDATRFAVLASIDELPGAAPPAPAASDARVGLGPIRLPDYVQRTAIVTRVGGTRLEPSDTERWAEPVERAVERVLALDLARELGVGHVARWPWYATDRPDVQVEIAFTRFERDESGTVVVAARWIARTLDESRGPIERDVRIERPTNGPDGASTALALSQALAELTRGIVEAWNAPVEGAPAR
jgi:uncharacterized lipoprotein YmbA